MTLEKHDVHFFESEQHNDIIDIITKNYSQIMS